MNNEMKVRTSNILIAVFWALAVVVWVPFLLLVIGTLEDYVFGHGRWDIDAGGSMIWAAITGAVVAVQYFVTGTVRFKFQKQ